MTASAKWLNRVKWDEHGLVPVIAQEANSGDMLMFAWMNRDALYKTVELGEAVYWSRSRKKLWHKGEESGHVQKVLEIRLDCDEDVVLLKIEQAGGIACHTGRHSCFFKKFEGDPKDGDWQEAEPVLKDPETIYTESEEKMSTVHPGPPGGTDRRPQARQRRRPRHFLCGQAVRQRRRRHPEEDRRGSHRDRDGRQGCACVRRQQQGAVRSAPTCGSIPS
jgi:phosphoribosyl-AMP cyclohydrolase